MNDIPGIINRLRARYPEMELLEYEPMSRHTSFRIGGPARLLAVVGTSDEARGVLSEAATEGARTLIVGNGSDLLVSDEGFDGVVLKLAGGEFSAIGFERERVTAGAGVTLAKLASAACERGLTGLEFAHGIPGTLGGGLYMNAGAYGGELKDVVVSVTCMDASGELIRLTNEECRFSYRHSVFSERPELLILGAEIELAEAPRDVIRERMDDLAKRRRDKQPLEYPSAGSAFKRPPARDGVPVYAAKLIEDCGLKGLSVGGAKVSEKHAGFIINTGGATFDDVVSLIGRVRETVLRETGIELEPEVRIVDQRG